MSRLRSAIALALWFVPASCALVACVGDDTNAPLPDAGAPDATVDGTTDGSSSTADGASEAGACSPFDASALDDASVARGLAIIKANKCQKCHGQTLNGNDNGLQTSYGTAYPPNLTPDPQTGLGCWTNDQIVTAILHGTDNQDQPLCPPMPRFGEIDGGLDIDAATAVADFLRTLTPFVNNVPNTDCSNLGDGGVDAGTDAGIDSGTDASTDAGSDAGSDASDASGDANDAAAADASVDDASNDAGPDADAGD